MQSDKMETFIMTPPQSALKAKIVIKNSSANDLKREVKKLQNTVKKETAIWINFSKSIQFGTK